MKSNYQRKLCVEFVDNTDTVKKKTSKSKKTLRSLINFLQERLNIELRYSQSLQSLAKSGGVSISHSIIDFKNEEEATIRDAINSIINFTIQESEIHKEFATHIKLNAIQLLDEQRKALSLSKRHWVNRIEILKKALREANEVFKKEHTRYNMMSTQSEDLKLKKDEQYKKYGLELNEVMTFDNMPKPIQVAEQKYEDSVIKLNDFKKNCTMLQEMVEKCQMEYNKGTQDLLEVIETQELERMGTIHKALDNYSTSVCNLSNQFESLHKLIDIEIKNIDPVKDLQSFINRYSTFADNDRLKGIYKEMGQYVQLNTSGSDHSSKGLGLYDKTSKAMGLQLKQLEEERKQKQIQEEIIKKENEKLMECQVLINKLKVIRETAQKIGDQLFSTNQIELLYQPRPQCEGTFRIGSRKTLHQFTYLLLLYKKPIEKVSFAQEKLEISPQDLTFLQNISTYLSKVKFQQPDDIHELLLNLLFYYKSKVQTDKTFFSKQASIEEKQFYASLLGVIWLQIRLIIFRHASFQMEAYGREINKFIDELELEHHSENQFSIAAIEFTINSLKYSKKVTKKDVSSFMFPLNYYVHHSLLQLYFTHSLEKDIDSFQTKEILQSDFSEIFNSLKSFSSTTLAVKDGYQLLHIIRVLYSHFLEKHIFTKPNDQQNLVLLQLKQLMQMLNTSHKKVLSQKSISVEMIKHSNIHEPLDFFNPHTQQPQKLLFRICNSWLLSDMQKEIFFLLSEYERNFGKCYNKLRLVVDLGGISYKISNFFASDGAYDQKIKSDILAKAGQKVSNEIMAQKKLWKPYTLNKNDENQTSILKVIQVFVEKLEREDRGYKSVWEAHLDVGDKKSETFLYHFAQYMNDLIEEDLTAKVDELDFDRDPHGILGDLIELLQRFDSLTQRKTINIIKPKLEQWIQLKLIYIKEVVLRCLNFENWKPVTDVILTLNNIETSKFRISGERVLHSERDP